MVNITENEISISALLAKAETYKQYTSSYTSLLEIQNLKWNILLLIYKLIKWLMVNIVENEISQKLRLKQSMNISQSGINRIDYEKNS